MYFSKNLSPLRRNKRISMRFSKRNFLEGGGGVDGGSEAEKSSFLNGLILLLIV